MFIFKDAYLNNSLNLHSWMGLHDVVVFYIWKYLPKSGVDSYLVRLQNYYAYITYSNMFPKMAVTYSS